MNPIPDEEPPASSASQTTNRILWIPSQGPTSQGNIQKPSLVLICPTGTLAFTIRYGSIIKKMRRDAHIFFALSPADLDRILSNRVISNSIVGFVVTDARIMGINTDADTGTDTDTDTNTDPNPNPNRGDAGADADMVEFSRLLAGIVNGAYLCCDVYDRARTHPYPNQIRSGARMGTGNRGIIRVNERNERFQPPHIREWTVVFAFDFPLQAARYPLRFGKYMANTFGVGWRICGATMGKCTLEISEKGLRKMGARVYRGNRYKLRAVFLENVDEEDKVLVVAKEASVGNGGLGSHGQPEVYYPEVDEGENENENVDGDLGEFVGWCVLEEQTDSTAGEEGEFDIARVEVGDESAGWTVAPDGNGPGGPPPPWGEEVDIEMIDAELAREETDWADDELTASEESNNPNEDEDEDEDTSSSNSSNNTTNEPPKQRVIYVNVPDHRGNPNVNSDSDEVSAAQSQHKRKKPHAVAQRIADCAVALHRVQSVAERRDAVGQRARVRGHVGFVGHVADNRSMASLILGMCGVKNTRPLPESMQAYLRDHNHV